MSNVQETMKTLLENPVLIYGAGILGRCWAAVLKNLGADVIGFAVTSMGSEAKTLCGYDVKEIGQWKDCFGKAIVLVASIRYQNSIIQTCKSNGIEDPIITDVPLYDFVYSLYFKPILTRHGVDLSGEAIQMGGGNYLNPFTQLEQGTGGYFVEMGDFILPPLFDDWEYTDEGPYEFGDVKLSPGDVVFDLGANYGVFSVFAVSRGAEIYAFEPTPGLGKIIERQSELNNVAIHLVPYAVSNVCEKTQFYVSDFAESNSLSGASFCGDTSAITVDQITIDEFVKRNNIPRVDFIKADIEGAERLMLEGAQETLKKFAPKLALCTYHLPDDKEVMTELILKANPDYKIEYKWKKLYAHV